MSWLSKISASIFSAANENNLALASVKFDFALVKVDAPLEFSGLGKALSTRRRGDAEDGPYHKTARRLAALFEQKVPSTPKLITAYGLRSSEIIDTPGINPGRSSQFGPFEAFVGADGTAMWAAATSGIPALGLYLLACILARAWQSHEATSIWVELVDQRRKEIEHEARTNCAVSESSLWSTRQEISREDLAQWDASARAWLQSADQAKAKAHTQLSLIIKNSQLPFANSATTYSTIVETWQKAMTCLECLLGGKPQAISDRSVLISFSAWHLYPNLICLGNDIRNVEFDDAFVHPKGVGTIAIEPRSGKAATGTDWSLALSHLCYYGNPKTVKSSIDFTRVNIHQLHIITLGCLFSAWRINKRDFIPAAQWLLKLGEYLRKGASKSTLQGLDWFKNIALADK